MLLREHAERVEQEVARDAHRDGVEDDLHAEAPVDQPWEIRHPGENRRPPKHVLRKADFALVSPVLGLVFDRQPRPCLRLGVELQLRPRPGRLRFG